MIKLKDVRKAINMIENPREYLSCKALHKQLVLSLERYETRGEFNGSLQSAIECLTLAGYEIQALEPQGDLQDEGVG